jgi:eukaryotic-like serine/threonine-protein kinase
MSLNVGDSIAQRYRLIRKLAVGGMGEVWEAADTRLARRVAIKVLKAELSGDPEFLQRFRTEARTTASLNHPGIAAVHDYGETSATPGGPSDTAYLVMELVEGEPLAAMLARRRRLSAERTLDVLEQAGHALQAAHERGLVHRDVKPGNILLTANGTVKLTDFGIAKAADAAPVTRSGMVMGTAHYIAPEQAMGTEAGPASDVYSLGVVGYECLTGHRPFLSDSAVTVAMMHIRDAPPPLPPDVPQGVRALVEATLVKDPRGRYGTGGEFAAAVAAVKAGRPLPRPAGVYAGPLPRSTGAFGAGMPPSSPGTPSSGVPLADAPTGPQPRLPFPPGTAPPGTPPAATPPPAAPARQRSLGPWIVVGLLLAAALAVGAWILVTVLHGGAAQSQSLSVTVGVNDYGRDPARALEQRVPLPNVLDEGAAPRSGDGQRTAKMYPRGEENT